MAVSRHRPGGQVVPIEALRAWVHAVLLTARACRQNDITLVYRLAEDRDTPIALGLAAHGATRVLLATGAFEPVKADLAAVDMPTTTAESMQLAGMLALSHSLVAAADSHPADADAAVQHAAELAARTGEGTAFGLGFGPTNVGLWRMEAGLEIGLEIGDHELVTALAKGLNPDVHPYRSRQSSYWRDYGRALAGVRGRHDDAVLGLPPRGEDPPAPRAAGPVRP
ncbi:MAG: hypothetical protein ACRDTG_27180 [Pseudonocardiaceae bacterium]